MQLYNLEGQPMETIPDGSPVPPGRWATPSGGFDTQNGGWGLGAGVYNGNVVSNNIPGDPAHQNYTAANNQLGGLMGPTIVGDPQTYQAYLNGQIYGSPNYGKNAATGAGGSLDTTATAGTPIPNAPPAMTVGGRNLMGEGATTLGAQVALAPLMLQQYQQYAPQYAQTDLSTMRQTLFGNFDAGQFEAAHPGFMQSFQSQQAQGQLQGWTPAQFAAAYAGLPADDPSLNKYYSGGMNSINNMLTEQANQQTVSANTALRTGNVNDASTLGGQALGTLKTLNPNQYSALDQTQAAAANPIQANSYQQGLGAMFNAGPQFNAVNGQSVTSNQIGAPSSVTTSANPLLQRASFQAATAGNGPLGNDLQGVARQQLALGSGLSDQQARDATQAARQAWAARGLINSNGAVGAEILNRDQYGQQLLAQREGFAQNVNQLGQSQQQLNNQYTLGVLGANATGQSQSLQAQQANQQAGLQAALANQQNAYQSQYATAGFGQQADLSNQQAALQAQQQNIGLGTNLAGIDYSRQQQNFGNLATNASLQSANAFNPYSQITSAGSANQGTNSGLFGQGATDTSGGLGNQNVMNQFNPYNSYSSDLYNTNYNAQSAQRISQGNNNAAVTGAAIGGVALVGAALF